MIQPAIHFLDDEEKALYEAIEADDYQPGKSQLTESEKDRLQNIASATLNETHTKIALSVPKSVLIAESV